MTLGNGTFMLLIILCFNGLSHFFQFHHLSSETSNVSRLFLPRLVSITDSCFESLTASNVLGISSSSSYSSELSFILAASAPTSKLFIFISCTHFTKSFTMGTDSPSALLSPPTSESRYGPRRRETAPSCCCSPCRPTVCRTSSSSTTCLGNSQGQLLGIPAREERLGHLVADVVVIARETRVRHVELQSLDLVTKYHKPRIW